jgi:hypothetical protein
MLQYCTTTKKITTKNSFRKTYRKETQRQKNYDKINHKSYNLVKGYSSLFFSPLVTWIPKIIDQLLQIRHMQICNQHRNIKLLIEMLSIKSIHGPNFWMDIMLSTSNLNILKFPRIQVLEMRIAWIIFIMIYS